MNINSSGSYTITGDGNTTNENIVVNGGNITITLNNVNIDRSNNDNPGPAAGSALYFNGYDTISNFTLNFSGNNTLISATNSAGISFRNDNGSSSLTIAGSGTLTAKGGNFAAGIGGYTYGFRYAVKNITINSGTIIATSGDGGSGIGGSYYAEGENITINGGNITATSSSAGAGIGGGEGAAGNNTTINGGIIKATGGWSYWGDSNGIGSSIVNSAPTASNIRINNAVVTANSIGGNQIITGKSSIKCSNLPQVYNSSLQQLYRVTIKNANNEQITVDSTVYPISQSHDDGFNYLYLTNQDHEITVGSNKYSAKWNESSSSFKVKGVSTVTINDELNKKYDGNAVEKPSITKTGSSAEATFTWYKYNGSDYEVISNPPSEAGEYKVEVNVAEDNSFWAASAQKTFTIEKNDTEFNNLIIDKSNITYGDTINVSFTPIAKATSGISLNSLSPKQAKLYLDGVEIASLDNINEGQKATFIVSTTDHALFPKDVFDGQSHTFMVKWGGDDNLNEGNASVNATLNKKDLTISANPYKIIYGDNLNISNLTVTYAGFINNEDKSVLSGTLAFDTNYNLYDNIGNYTITPKGLSADYYNIIYKNATLTVEPREVKLIWNNTEGRFHEDGLKVTATAGNIVNNDKIDVIVENGNNDTKGSYTATAKELTGNKAANYKLPSVTTKNYTINGAYINIDKISLSLEGKETNLFTFDDTITVSFTHTTKQMKRNSLTDVKEGEFAVFYQDKQVSQPQAISVNNKMEFNIDTYENKLEQNANGYKFTIKFIGNSSIEDYSLDSETFYVDWLQTQETAPLEGQEGINNWYVGDITLLPPEDFTICDNLYVNWENQVIVNKEGNFEYTYYLKNAKGQIAKKTTQILLDKTTPVIESVKINNIKTDSAEITIKANDNISSIASYSISLKDKPDDVIDENQSGVFKLSKLKDNNTYNYIITIKDNAGNTSTKELTFKTKAKDSTSLESTNSSISANNLNSVKSADTSDTNNLLLWILVFIVSIFSMIFVYLKKHIRQ